MMTLKNIAGDYISINENSSYLHLRGNQRLGYLIGSEEGDR